MDATAEEATVLGEIDHTELKRYAQEKGFDFSGWIQRIISGNIDMTEWVATLFENAKDAFLSDFRVFGAAILSPGMILIIPRLLMPRANESRYAMSFACRVCCISALAACFVQMRSVSEELMNTILEASEMLVPVMISAVTLSGADTSAVFLTPMSGILVNIIQEILQKYGIAVSSTAAVVAVSGNLSESIRLKRLFELLKRFLHWGTGTLVGVFTALLALQGKLGVGRDSAATRTARYAIENLVPVIGGNISESLDALLSAAVNVKNAIGASGLMLMVSICAAPIVRLLGSVLMLKLCAAILEPVEEEMMTAMIAQFGDAVEMLVILSLAAVSLSGLLLFGCMGAAQNLVR